MSNFKNGFEIEITVKFPVYKEKKFKVELDGFVEEYLEDNGDLHPASLKLTHKNWNKDKVERIVNSLYPYIYGSEYKVTQPKKKKED